MSIGKIIAKIGLYLFRMTLKEDKSTNGWYLFVLHFLLAHFLEIPDSFMHKIGYAIFDQLRFHALHFVMMHKEI